MQRPISTANLHHLIDEGASSAIYPTKLESSINLQHIVLQAIAQFQGDSALPSYQSMQRPVGIAILHQKKHGPDR